MERENSHTDENELTGEERERIVDACDRHGFPLAEAAFDGEILQLTPQSLEELPGGQQLEALAAELEDTEYRFVTFRVPESDDRSSK